MDAENADKTFVLRISAFIRARLRPIFLMQL